MTGGDEGDRWLYQGDAVGWAGPEPLEFTFGADRVDHLTFDGIRLPADDRRLDWFDLAGAAPEGGPFPPDFAYSPFDRRALARRSRASRFAAPFGFGNGFAEVVRDGVAVPAPAALRSGARGRTLRFAKAHSTFFACGETPVLHVVSDEGVVEWFATGDLLGRGPDEPLVGHGYGAPIGRLLPRHRRGVAVGRTGFATVADDRPVWVRATPFGAERQSRDTCPCDRALAAPTSGPDGFAWPVLVDGEIRIAVRPDAVGGTWSLHPVADHADAVALAPPRRLEGGIVVWVGEEGCLVGHGADWRWRTWPAGFRALVQHAPHLDVQEGAWQLGEAPSGYAFARLSSGRQDMVPTSGLHFGGVRFTIQGTDFLDRPAHDDHRRRPLPAIDGKLAVPVLSWEDGAVVALSGLPPRGVPEAFFSTAGAAAATFTYRFLSFDDLGLVDLGTGMMSWTHHRDLQAFVFAGHLFLTSSWEKRCVVLSA